MSAVSSRGFYLSETFLELRRSQCSRPPYMRSAPTGNAANSATRAVKMHLDLIRVALKSITRANYRGTDHIFKTELTWMDRCSPDR
ncbi:hypothetical protein chiPu_0011738 [Chiloscyllium punctatum]|uniref:Uncharacterized protein n=1 Tax=Chiloscyllium punctatum TaxID=137246 RepID=A0A401SS89_CHIPU|nr:hypothetical protein [Chiloscyllium punctatum]